MYCGIRMKFHWWGVLLLFVIFFAFAYRDDVFNAFRVAFLCTVLTTVFGLIPHEVAHALASSVKTGTIHCAGIAGGWLPDEEDWNRLNEKQKAIVYIAGPAANLMIYAITSLILFAADLSSALHSVVWIIQTVSLWIALLNLLPMYPLDGGRLIHAAMSVFSLSTGQMQMVLVTLTLIAGIVRFLLTGLDSWLITFEVVLMVVLSLAVIGVSDLEFDGSTSDFKDNGKSVV